MLTVPRAEGLAEGPRLLAETAAASLEGGLAVSRARSFLPTGASSQSPGYSLRRQAHFCPHNTSTRMVTAALFIVVRNWKQPNDRSAGEGVVNAGTSTRGILLGDKKEQTTDTPDRMPVAVASFSWNTSLRPPCTKPGQATQGQRPRGGKFRALPSGHQLPTCEGPNQTSREMCLYLFAS